MSKQKIAAAVPATTEAPPPGPSQILALAVQSGADPEIIEKMLCLQERWEANEAKKQFVKAMAAFKQRAPAVLARDGEVDFKTSKGRTHYKHSTLGSIVTQTAALLGEHGLSVSWSTSQQEGQITVSCHVTHEAGHSECVTLTAPPDDSGNKNRIQQVGSTVTYLQRYTVLAVLGFATADQDDNGITSDGHDGMTARIKEQQLQKIAGLCKGLDIKRQDWAPAALNLFPAGVRRLRDMSEASAAELITRLTQAKTKADLVASTAAVHDPLMDDPPQEPEPEPAPPEPEADSVPPDVANLIAEIAPLVAELNNTQEKALFATCKITGPWREAPVGALHAMLNHLNKEPEA